MKHRFLGPVRYPGSGPRTLYGSLVRLCKHPDDLRGRLRSPRVGGRIPGIRHDYGICRARAERALAIIALCALVTACQGIPEGATAVEDFELERYLGTWYEIARLDHGFERGLSHVQARYSRRDDGGVRVINRGFDEEKGQWSEAEGKAYFLGDPDIGRLKVSFFGPFYGAYNIVELDHENYGYAMVTGPNTRYLWILARDPQLEPAIVDRLVARADALGFPVEELIFPGHDAMKN